ncbi:GNAT family N-acetyltransferase [Flindersiella endophytica]
MNIRPAIDTDRAAIDALIRQLYPGFDGEPTLPRVRQASRTLVAEAGGALAGTAVAMFTDYGVEAYGLIDELVVDEAHRGQGIGSALVEQARAWCFEQGARVVFVSAGTGAEEFYRQVGFAECTGPWLYSVPDSVPRSAG